MAPHVCVFMALRYLRPNRSFVSLITLLSVLGPIFGVAVLIIVLAVMAGFNRDIREKILSSEAHIQLLPGNTASIDDPEPILEALDAAGIPASPVVTGPVPLQIADRDLLEVKLVRGIDPKREPMVSDISRKIVQGRFEINEDEVLISTQLQFQLGVGVGDTIILHAPAKLSRMVNLQSDGSGELRTSQEVYVPEEVTVAGIFNLGMYRFDISTIIVHIEKADELFGLEWGAAHHIQLRTEDPFDMRATEDTLMRTPQLAGMRVLTWQEANQTLFGALRVEKNMMFFLLFFITVVAAFGIATTLITVVVQKTREIGVLKALGASPRAILAIFLLQGAIVGGLGTLGGTALGLLVIHRRDWIAEMLEKLWNVQIFPPELYQLSAIPALVEPMDVILVVLSALVICVLAALVPAGYAAQLAPAQALRSGGGE
jgi:lipoprotein-releasing system permease protein